MSTTRINYDLVVQELSKTLQQNKDGAPIPYWLREHRTLRIGAPRQSGMTELAIELIAKRKGETLYLSSDILSYEDTIKRFVDRGIRASDVLFFYDNPELLREESNNRFRFSQVIVDDSGLYFNRYKFSKFFKALAELVTDDVVIYLLR